MLFAQHSGKHRIIFLTVLHQHLAHFTRQRSLMALLPPGRHSGHWCDLRPKAIQEPLVNDFGVDFAHIRATHGETIVDGQLRRHGEGLVKAGIPFGTYHFFSSLSDPAAQARNYLDTIAFLEPHAMLPPVLDMEWDISASDPESGDRWAEWTPREIADAMETWLTMVETETGARPMIYTNASWWQARLGAEGDRFQAYPLWISRYGQFDRHLPDVPPGFDVAFWQFSEDASVPGITETFNASRLNGDFVRRSLAR